MHPPSPSGSRVEPSSKPPSQDVRPQDDSLQDNFDPQWWNTSSSDPMYTYGYDNLQHYDYIAATSSLNAPLQPELEPFPGWHGGSDSHGHAFTYRQDTTGNPVPPQHDWYSSAALPVVGLSDSTLRHGSIPDYRASPVANGLASLSLMPDPLHNGDPSWSHPPAQDSIQFADAVGPASGSALGLGMLPPQTSFHSQVYPSYDIAASVQPQDSSLSLAYEPFRPPPSKRRNSRARLSDSNVPPYINVNSALHPSPWQPLSPSILSNSISNLNNEPGPGPSASMDPAAVWSNRSSLSAGSFPSPTPSLALSLHSQPSMSQRGDNSARASPHSDIGPSPWRRDPARLHAPNSPAIVSGSRSLPPSTAPKTKPLPPVVPDLDWNAHPVAAHAREQRSRYSFTESPSVSANSSLQGSPASSTGSGRRPAPVKAPRMTPVLRKTVREDDVACSACGVAIGHVILRGKEQALTEPYRSHYHCLRCSPHYRSQIDDDPDDGDEKDGPPARYENTLSAALDKLDGVVLEIDEDRPPARKGNGVAAKKRKAETAQDVVECDVCTRDIATGQLRLDETGGPVNFYVEMVCVHCIVKYQRCTDCGGGGGPRIGVGRWRSKELFPGGRRTCRLSHVRLGGVNEMTYDVWSVKDLIQHPQFEEFLSMARELYMSAMLATLAIPDMLECAEPLARTYTEAEKVAFDGFSMMEPLMRVDVEEEQGFRRYVGIRWSTQKKKLDPESQADEALNDWDRIARMRPQQLIRKDKTFASFAIGELELQYGSVCIPLSMPKGTGDSYDAATALQQVMLRRMQFDLEETNARRDVPYPEISEVWAIQMYKKESRIMNRLETQRGMMTLSEYKTRHADVFDPKHFPPHRPMFLPAEFLVGWRVHARRFSRTDDLTKKGTRSRRKLKPGESAVTSNGD